MVLKNRIDRLEKEVKDKSKPNNGCAIVSYPDNPLTDAEIKEFQDKGIKVIEVVFT